MDIIFIHNTVPLPIFSLSNEQEYWKATTVPLAQHSSLLYKYAVQY